MFNLTLVKSTSFSLYWFLTKPLLVTFLRTSKNLASSGLDASDISTFLIDGVWAKSYLPRYEIASSLKI